MRAAIVAEQIDRARGGAEVSTLEMATALAALGLEMSIVTRSSLDGPSAGGAVRIVTLATRGGRRASTARFLSEAEAHCRAARYDVVHAVAPLAVCHVYQPRGGTFPETIRRSDALPDSVWPAFVRRLGRRFNARQQFLRRCEDTLLRRADPPVVACVSDYVRRQVLADWPGFPTDRLRVIFNAVAIEPLDALSAADARATLRSHWAAGDRPVLLFLAHNFRLKGLRPSIRALARLPAALLVVAGRDQTAAWQRLAAQLGCADRVRFVGAGLAVRELFAAADVLAHPTYYDPCSRVVLEALRCGLPAATTRWNGAAEVVEPGRTGEIIDDPDDETALAAALERCGLPERRAAAANAAAALGARLTMARHARELAELYRFVTRS